MKITTLIAKLPSEVTFENVRFVLRITSRGNDEQINLAYELTGLTDFATTEQKEFFDLYDSWWNPFTDTYTNFLWLYERIESDEELIGSLNNLHKFLTDNNIS